MKKLFVITLLLGFLGPLPAQPPNQPLPRWTVKAGNPVVIENRKDWGNYQLGSAAFSPDGALLVVTGAQGEVGGAQRRGLVMLCDARTGEARGELPGHIDIVWNLAFSPDGKLLATQSSDGALWLWDIATRTVLHRLGAGGERLSLEEILSRPSLEIGAWSPNGKTFAAIESRPDTSTEPPTYSYAVKLFDAASGKLQRTFARRAGYISATAWTSDGKNLVTAVQFQRNGKVSGSEIAFLDRESGEIVRRVAQSQDERFNHALNSDATRALFTTPVGGADGKQATTEQVSVWDLKNDRALWTQPVLKGAWQRAEFSRDGATLVAGADGEVTLRDAATGTVRQTLPDGGSSTIRSLTLSPDGQRIASVDWGYLSSVYLWKLDETLPTPRYASQIVLRGIWAVSALDWSGDALRAISGISDTEDDEDDEKNLLVGRELRIDTWNAVTSSGETRSISETRLLRTGEISPDGNLLAIELATQPKPEFYKTAGIGIYDLREAKLLRVLPAELDISGIAWSPDGKTLATNLHGSTITLWNVATGETRQVLQTKAEKIAWARDGAILAAGAGDGTIELFDVQSGAKLRDWKADGAVRALEFSPDGKTLAVGLTRQADTKFATSSVQLFDTATGNAGRTFATQGALWGVRWTPDGTGIAASSQPATMPNVDRTLTGQLRVWDVATGAERITINDRRGMGSFAFSPDGAHVATLTSGRVRVWDLK